MLNHISLSPTSPLSPLPSSPPPARLPPIVLSCPSLLLSFHQAILGQAVDRHLLGLKLLAAEAGMETPAIYNDVAYTRSLHFRLSTSQVLTLGHIEHLSSLSFM